jgi:EF-hand domain pair
MQKTQFSTPIHKRNLVLAKTEELKEIRTKLKKIVENKRKIIESCTESWLLKHGKSHYVKIDNNKKKNLRRCFLSIDLNGNRSIELAEIIEAMLTLGIAENKYEAKQIFKEIDKDNSGHIEFNEFLLLLKSKGPRVKSLIELFDRVIEKKMGFDLDMLPFQLIVSNYRRNMIMRAVMEPGNPKEELILKSTSQVFSRNLKQLKKDLEKNYKPKDLYNL